jgi:hypothetical protein
VKSNSKIYAVALVCAALILLGTLSSVSPQTLPSAAEPIRRIQTLSDAVLLESDGTATGYASNQTSTTLPNAPTQGNVLVAAVGFQVAVTNSPLVSFNVASITEKGVTWTRQVNQSSLGFGEDVEIWLGTVGQNPDPTIVFNFYVNPATPSFFAVACDVCEYSGVAATSPLDRTAVSIGQNGTSTTGQTAVTTQNSELWVGAILYTSSIPQTLPTKSFTLVGGDPGGAGRLSTALLERFVNQNGSAQSGTSIIYDGQTVQAVYLGCIATFVAKEQIATPTPSPTPIPTVTASPTPISPTPTPVPPSPLPTINGTPLDLTQAWLSFQNSPLEWVLFIGIGAVVVAVLFFMGLKNRRI